MSHFVITALLFSMRFKAYFSSKQNTKYPWSVSGQPPCLWTGDLAWGSGRPGCGLQWAVLGQPLRPGTSDQQSRQRWPPPFRKCSHCARLGPLPGAGPTLSCSRLPALLPESWAPRWKPEKSLGCGLLPAVHLHAAQSRARATRLRTSPQPAQPPASGAGYRTCIPTQNPEPTRGPTHCPLPPAGHHLSQPQAPQFLPSHHLRASSPGNAARCPHSQAPAQTCSLWSLPLSC